ncbi:hypothetical protein B5V00_16440 [Geothermobacter hydrogeniphilus]|uniref:DUF4019 domain-containing protein n=1 Tax=Geothermobacter hydrogeniphilus TaxID=1969733 RepID=A0A1X0XK78_9BACT|nr:hypothetical protein B5V00_16440 [Geothermobacter hydrogeniphilus]
MQLELTDSGVSPYNFLSPVCLTRTGSSFYIPEVVLLRKYGIHVTLLLAALAIIILPRLHQKPDPAKLAEANRSATRFLQLVDNQNYEQSWQAAAKLLQEKVPSEEWIKKLTSLRQWTGPVVERKQVEARYTTEAKDSPDGEYIMLNYESKYRNQPDTKEQIIVMLDDDHLWRVAGYFVK